MGGTATTNGSIHGEATALLDRKLRVAETLTCRQLFVDLEEIDARIERGLRDRVDLDQRFAAAQAQLGEAESLAALAVEGKNEAERKARKTEILRDDPVYRQAVAAVREAERQRAEADADAESLKRKARRIERQIDYRCAALNFLGG